MGPTPPRLLAATTWGVLVVLLVALVVGMGPNMATRAVAFGDLVWPGYAELRTDPAAPDCDVDALAARAAACTTAPTAAAPQDPSFDPFAAAPPSEFDPFGGSGTAASENCEAVAGLATQCKDATAAYQALQERITPELVRFRSVEQFAGGLATFGWWRHMLALATLIGGLATTWTRTHVGLRDPVTRLEHLAQQGLQAVAHIALALSCLADAQIQLASTADGGSPAISLIWAAGFASWAGANVIQMIRVPHEMTSAPTPPIRLPMVVSLHTWMALAATAWFTFEGHPSGLAIYLHKFTATPAIYVGVGLYIWAGMLLAHTRVAERAFDVVLPFGLPIHLLVWLVVVGSALPTAYSGASGIFVIAAGAVIFRRLRAAGAHPRLAVAATAMSGSLGVVLQPCLVVVLIAALNKQVTTSELFEWGRWVFALTSALLLIAMLAYGRFRVTMAPLGQALPSAGRAAARLLPYALISALVLAGYGWGLGTHIDEHNAPLILPGVLLALLAWDRWDLRREDPEATPFVPALRAATHDSTSNIGALLAVMFASVAFGGVVERSAIMDAFPRDLGGPWPTMALMVVVMIVVGMLMDALGAVVLISVSVAGIAIENGIHPLHFWMMVLVGFELGYLTPPVALNLLLTRAVVGREARVEEDPVPGFFASYEHVLLPAGVMAVALLIVAFVPLWIQGV